jgi:hypothetical protein
MPGKAARYDARVSERPHRTHIWVIFRHETWGDRDLNQRVSGTKAYRNRQRAEAEVSRLNTASVKVGRGAQYFVTLVRLIEDPNAD